MDTYKVTVDYSRSVEELVAELTRAGCCLMDGSITSSNFPTAGKGVIEQDVFLVHLERDASTEEVLAEMKRQELQPATNHELLSLGVAQPELVEGFPIIQLGSIGTDSSGRRCVSLFFTDYDTWQAYLALDQDERQSKWSETCRFLAVRSDVRDRARKILEEFSIPENLLRVFAPGERPLHHEGLWHHTDGRAYTHPVTKVCSYYRATFCIRTFRKVRDPRYGDIHSIDIPVDFDTGVLRRELEDALASRDVLKAILAQPSRPIAEQGSAKRVKIRKVHYCEVCRGEIPRSAEAVVYSSMPPDMVKARESCITYYGGHYHPVCYETARSANKSLPPVT